MYLSSKLILQSPNLRWISKLNFDVLDKIVHLTTQLLKREKVQEGSPSDISFKRNQILKVAFANCDMKFYDLFYDSETNFWSQGQDFVM